MADAARSRRQASRRPPIGPRLVCACLLLVASFGSARAASFVTDPGASDAYRPGEILIQLATPPGEGPDAAAELTRAFAGAGLRPERLLSRRSGVWLFRFDAGEPAARGAGDEALLAAVRRHPAVRLAQFNHLVTPRSRFPDDPRFPDQWALHYTGGHGGVPDSDIDAPEAWDLCTSGVTALGDTVVIAIVDDGSSLTHEDLRFWKNWHEIPGNGQDDDHNGYIDDYHGWNALAHNGTIPSASHGTHVTGIAAARGNNATGVSGVNWDAHVLPVVGSAASEAVVIEAYGYVLEMRARYNETGGERGAFVVVENTSFGIDHGDPAQYPLWCDLYDALGEEGVVSTAATANQAWNIDVVGDMPTACPSDYLITVTSTTIGNDIYYRAAWGLTTIDLGAPGDIILSTDVGNTYANRTGTSQASPHVAGAVALLIAAGSEEQSELYREQPAQMALAVKEAILRTVDPLPALQGRTVSGGRLNLYNAVAFWQSSTAVDDPGTAPHAAPVLLAARPNPCTGATRFELLAPEIAARGARMWITDAAGRLVRSLCLRGAPPGAEWDGRDDRGHLLPGGMYVCRVDGAVVGAAGRVLLLR